MPGRGSVRAEKLEHVEALANKLRSSRTTAVIGVRGVPASALQKMRRSLREKGHPIFVATNSSLRHAIEAAAPDRPALKPLLDHVNDQTAILSAEGNPFTLYQELAKTRSPTPARGGELAPKDITVSAQTTSFKPGPIVGELQHAGFPAAIEKGKVVIKKDATVVKAGAVISREVAGLLTRLEIFPLEVGLELRAAVDGDTFYAPELLVTRAHRRALALAVAAGYVTPATLPAILAKALAQARAVDHLTGA
jgi:large subunit ribosomal protein L10